MSHNYINRCCPICSEDGVVKLEVFSPSRAERKSFEELRPYWNGFFKEKIFFSYARCSKCDLLYAPIFYDSNQLQALYAQMPPNMDVVPLKALEKTQQGYFSEIRNYSSMEGDYIEIGPDTGIFVRFCVQEGGFKKYWLFEPNKAVVDDLKSAVYSKEFAINEDMFGFSAIPNNSASITVMIQVLDHLLDPVSTLRELREKLLPDGRLLLVTHNENSFLRKLVGWRWPAFCLQHPQIYNPRSMEALLDKAGYKVDSIKRSTNYFEFSFLLKHLIWAFGFKVNGIPRIFDFTVGLKLGNMITVASLKKS